MSNKRKLKSASRAAKAARRPSATVSPIGPGGARRAQAGVSRWARWKSRLNAEVNGASLAVIRIVFGAIMALEAYWLCHPSASTFDKSRSIF